MHYITYLILFIFLISKSYSNTLPDTTSYTILAPIRVNMKEHIDYPIFFVSEINDMEEPVDEPPKGGLIVLSDTETGKLKMVIFDNKEIRPPYLIKRKDKKGRDIFNYIYLWHYLDLKPFCNKDGKYQVFIISNHIRSNLIDFDTYGTEEDCFFDFYPASIH